jgi:hypothetical protein
MSHGVRTWLATALACSALLTATAGAGAPPERALRPGAPPVTWSGTLSFPDPGGCGDVTSRGCDTTPVVIDAPSGAWITVSVNDSGTYVRVTHDGRTVGNAGTHVGTAPSATGRATPTTTFRHVRSGRATYVVGVSHGAAHETSKISYTATARLAGTAYDREGDCGVTPGLTTSSAEGDRTLPLSVRLVSAAADKAAVREAGQGLVEIYAAIGIRARVSYDTVAVPAGEGDSQRLIDVVRRRYGGVRPRGVDVVHLLTDNFSGGYALCIGGVAYPEYAFSVGGIHYAASGVVPVSTVEAAVVTAHEIGHLLGAQHQQSNCVEAAPSGACTVMFPAAAGATRTFATIERHTIREFTAAYARG